MIEPLVDTNAIASPFTAPFTGPMPANEPQRLAALHRYKILDTPPEEAFDRITTLAARLFNMPIVLVSLVDESRAWFKSSYGFDPSEVRREDALCSFSLLSDEILVILDTRQSSEFLCNAFVQQEPGVRCYVGAPLITQEGFNLGTLCLLDTQPHEAFSPEQQATLQDLAAVVVDELELRLAAQRIAQTDAAILKITQGVSKVTGEAFFEALVQHFAAVLGVAYAHIGLVADREAQSMRTIAMCAHGEIVENFDYLIKETPCESVIQQRKLCCYPKNVQSLFPQSPILSQYQIESYVAVPFYDSNGSALGLLVLMDSKVLENVQLAEYLLSIFALRIAAELERQQVAEQQAQMLIREQQARQQAETNSRIKDEFLAVLSHELRSPLNPILGWAKLLQQRNLDTAKTKTALETIERNAQLQAQLIDDLLDISRILCGKLSLKIAPVDLRTVIESALQTVQLAAEAKSLQVQTLLPSSPVMVMGDDGRLQQIIWNLLSNAVKFTPTGGDITISLTAVSTHAEISVMDTGKGIETDFLPYVFEHFRQEDGATTRQFGGLGLGLAIARQMVELHGGTIAADSAGEGQGATFTAQIPLAPPPQQHFNEQPFATESSSAMNDLTGLNILAVDDDFDSRELLTFMLEAAGASVTCVASAYEALQAIECATPDFIVSDIGMPEIDGYTLLQHIRARSPARQVPAIALTAYAGEFDRQEAMQAGFQKHLSKPIDPNHLVQAILNAIQGDL